MGVDLVDDGLDHRIDRVVHRGHDLVNGFVKGCLDFDLQLVQVSGQGGQSRVDRPNRITRQGADAGGNAGIDGHRLLTTDVQRHAAIQVSKPAQIEHYVIRRGMDLPRGKVQHL